MLTPQEVSSSEFEKAVFGGYDTASVDKFLTQVTQDYSALYRENGILKNKMKVLVDKVEEYRSTEDAMRMALLQAERTAKEMLTAAEAERDSIEAEVAQKKGELMRQAEEEAESRRAEIRESLASEEAALERAKSRDLDPRRRQGPDARRPRMERGALLPDLPSGGDDREAGRPRGLARVRP